MCINCIYIHVSFGWGDRLLCTAYDVNWFLYISPPLIKNQIIYFYLSNIFPLFQHSQVPRDKFLNSHNKIFVRWMSNTWKFHDWVCKFTQLVHYAICFSIYICIFRILDQFGFKKILLYMNWYFNESRIWIHFKTFIYIAELVKNRNLHMYIDQLIIYYLKWL